MAKRWIHSAFLTTAAALATVAVTLSPAIAATTPAPAKPTNSNGQGIEISPPVLDLKASPGQTLTANIRIRNVTSGDLAIKGQVDDFGAKGEDGEPDLLLDETSATRYSVKFWISNVPSFTLKPQEVRTAQIQISVPANAEPGGHYGVVRFTGLPPGIDSTGVSLSASIGSLILLSVSGNITQKLSISEFYATKNDAKKRWFETGPIVLNERIRNEGSVHVKPEGFVTVKNMFGKQVQRLPISEPAHNILPDSIRKFSQPLDKKFMFGRYTAQFSAKYGDGHTLDSQKISFWVIPVRLILSVLAGILILFFALRFAIKRYNRFIIKQAKRKE